MYVTGNYLRFPFPFVAEGLAKVILERLGALFGQLRGVEIEGVS
ncbi:hypothetical protein FDJ28_gp01 [Pseudomonas phage Bjorn]|uniref:Uncharacterized protein n=1 Tax=Pseudomonas phage Bjorn TaxID=2079288 RepID=A0A2K9VHG7_9CAUD|nr:hypothetical protein FDJ28_gp01 [Pseudomonas phage Bjorn]AUV61747.1 hypothetical protein PsPhBjorn_gp69 [Pseudomonas phage Bjorn]